MTATLQFHKRHGPWDLATSIPKTLSRYDCLQKRLLVHIRQPLKLPSGPIEGIVILETFATKEATE